MDNVDVGLLVLAAGIWLIAGLILLVTRRFGHDQIYHGLTPGQVPPPNGSREITRVGPGREYSGEVAVQFHPPRGLTPGLVGTVVDGKAEMRDVTATIVDLAVRKYLKITPIDPEAEASRSPSLPWLRPGARGGGGAERKDWLITRLRGPQRRDDDEHLLDFEARLLQELFSRGDQVRMSELSGRFGSTMHAVVDDLYRSVQQRGWYKGHPQRNAGGCLRALAVGGGTMGGIVFFLAGGSIWAALSGLMLVGAGLTLAQALKWRTARTAEGTAIQIQTLGFKKYLATAEAEQIRFEEAADIFSRYLPYAIVFGVAEHWTRVFGDVAARAQAVGYDMPLALDWFDGLYLAMVVDDLLIGMDGVGGLLDVIGDSGGLLELADAGEMFSGLSGFAENIGDFVGGIDFGDFDF